MIEGKIRNSLGVTSNASDEELEKAKENWINTTLGITLDASSEEKNKGLRTSFYIDEPEEDVEKMMEQFDSIYGNEILILKSYDESSDEMKDRCNGQI